MATKSLLQAIGEGLAEEMRLDDTVMVLARTSGGPAGSSVSLRACRTSSVVAGSWTRRWPKA